MQWTGKQGLTEEYWSQNKIQKWTTSTSIPKRACKVNQHRTQADANVVGTTSCHRVYTKLIQARNTGQTTIRWRISCKKTKGIHTERRNRTSSATEGMGRERSRGEPGT